MLRKKERCNTRRVINDKRKRKGTEAKNNKKTDKEKQNTKQIAMNME